MRKKLTDDEVYQRLYDAVLALGDCDGETDFGNNTLRTGRLALSSLQMALIAHIDQVYVEVPIPGVSPRPPKDP